MFFIVEHSACVIMACYESDKTVIETLPHLAILLYKENIVGEMITESGEKMLLAVKDAVCAKHDNLVKFAAVLQKSTAAMTIADMIIKHYSMIIHFA